MRGYLAELWDSFAVVWGSFGNVRGSFAAAMIVELSKDYLSGVGRGRGGGWSICVLLVCARTASCVLMMFFSSLCPSLFLSLSLSIHWSMYMLCAYI